MEYSESVFDGLWVDSFKKNSKVILLGIYDSSKIGVSDNTMICVAEYSKIGEELGCKEGTPLGVYKVSY